MLHVSALGLYRAFVNGQRVGADLLTPGWTCYDDRIAYQSYDISHLVTAGLNRIKIWLGDGWYRSPMMWADSVIPNCWGERVAAIAEIVAGEDSLCATGTDWKSGLLPVTGSGIYYGEDYDARLESAAAFGGVVPVEFDTDMLVARETAAVQALPPILPCRSWSDEAGRKIYDFGQNVGGIITFAMCGDAGAVVRVEHAEVLGPALRHASPRLLEMLGLAENAIDALPFADLLRRKAFADREGSAGLEHLEECLSGEKPFRDIGLKLNLDGAVRWWTVTAKPLTNETGHVMGWRGVLADVTETRDTHESLVRLAHHCSLTDLANRHYFVMRLSDDLRNLSDRRHLAVLYIDLDDFKKVNDSFGHSIGDKLLKNIASRLQETVRQDDLVARLGGDEFAVMLHDVQDETQALSYAKRLIDFVEPAYRVDDKVMPVGMSIGVALAPLHGKKPDELMRAADLAMYAAKAEGKGTVCVFSPAMGEQNRRRRLLEAGLQDAMKHDQLHLVYQPQVNIETGEVTSVEALARWEHPILGTIAPTEFIPIAEETGQIEAIGRWILKRACLQACEWPEQIGLSVNVSTTQAVTDTLIESVQEALNHSGLAVERLELEITESIFLSDNPASLRLLHSLRDLGVRVAMDDFGVGYSSLAYLRKFPFSSLKIDRAFTHEVVTSEQSRAIIRAIIGLARSMGMTIIAEGVERPEQVRILKRLGADCAQGYLFAVPVSGSSVNATLDQWPAERHRSVPGRSIEGLVRDHLAGEA